jgi:hypothetical protein
MTEEERRNVTGRLLALFPFASPQDFWAKPEVPPPPDGPRSEGAAGG